MAAEYMHIGIPVTTKKPNMEYNDMLKFWVNTDVDTYDYKIEYLKFDEGTPFPEIMHKNPHVAYKVDDMTHYLKDADRIIFEPYALDEHTKLAFIIKDDAIIELYEVK
jgi:glyoxylase I family protein